MATAEVKAYMGATVSIIIPLKPSSFNADGVGNVLINGIKREQEEGGVSAPVRCWRSPVLTVFLSPLIDLLLLLPD